MSSILQNTVFSKSQPHPFLGGQFQDAPSEPEPNINNLDFRPSSVPNDTRIGRFLNLKISFLTHHDFSSDSEYGKQIKAEVIYSTYKNLTSNNLTGTLYDPRMGSVPSNIMNSHGTQICATCSGIQGLRPQDCIGHMGVIRFPQKIFNPYMNLIYEVIDILSCFCLECMELYIPIDVLLRKNIMDIKPENRVKVIAGWSNPADVVCKAGRKRCKKKEYMKKESFEGGMIVYKEGGTVNKKSAEEVYNMFMGLDTEVYRVLGFNEASDFDKYTLVGIIVPPIKMRMPNKTSTGAKPHMFTLKLSEIVDHVNATKVSLENKKIAEVLKDLNIDEKRIPSIASLNETIRTYRQDLAESQAAVKRGSAVQDRIAKLEEGIALMERRLEFLKRVDVQKSIQNGIFVRHGDTAEKLATLYKSVAAYFKETGALFQSKEGIIRSNIVAKRADFTARAVITPNTYGRLDTLEIPESIAKEAGIIDTVTEENIIIYTNMLTEGKISFIETKNRLGARIPVSQITISQGTCRLRIGDKVTRWLMDGDLVVGGREPTLHPGNIMGFFAKVVPGYTIGVPFGVVTPWAGDFDGDTAHLSIPQTEQAKSDVLNIMLASRNIVGIRTGAPIIGVIYNALKTWTVATASNKRLSKDLVSNAIEDLFSQIPEETVFASSDRKSIIQYLKERCRAHGVDYRTGRGLFSVLLPENFNYPPGDLPSKTGVKILNGVLISGIVTDVDIAANKPGSVVHQLFRMHETRDSGYRAAALFIHKAFRLGDYMSEYFPFTLSTIDCSLEQCGIEKSVFKQKTETTLKQISALGPRPSDPYELEAYEQEISNLNQDLLTQNAELYKKLLAQNEPPSMEELALVDKYNDLHEELKTLKSQYKYGQFLQRKHTLENERFALNLEKATLNKDIIEPYLEAPDLEPSEQFLESQERVQEIVENVQAITVEIAELEVEYEPFKHDYTEASFALESEIKEISSQVADIKARQTKVDEGILNQFYLGIKAGTKGSVDEFGEMTGIIGRVTIDAMNDVTCDTRCLSGYRVGSKEPGALGFISSSFYKGLSIPEKFNAQKVQRQPQSDAATKTPEAGRLERELSTTLSRYFTDSGCLVSQNFNLLQYCAGEDAFHPNYLFPLYGINVPFDPKIVMEMVNADLGWRKLADGQWYHQHRVNGETYYVKY